MAAVATLSVGVLEFGDVPVGTVSVDLHLGQFDSIGV
jgi:hypothetical protein